ncbi:MAG: hypothetical protein CMJ46_00380 [Planctomyces sp.]|nr:hypothetical protein [Planctomyces sp.]
MELSGPFSLGSTDSQLIRSAQADHPNSWSVLVETYAPLIYQTARKSGLQSSDAADITQNVLVQVYNSLKNFKPQNRGSFRKWIKVIARNKVIDLCRKRQISITILNEDIIADCEQRLGEGTSEVPNQRLRGIRKVIADVRGNVSEDTWQAFEAMLAGFETSREIGKRLGMSETAVRLAKHRVLAQIQVRLEKDAPPDETA